MNVVIMQPYFFPYLGYFNLLHSSDLFILLDDVQFIRRGWINRNRIQLVEAPLSFTVPVAKASRDTPINRTLISPDHFAGFADKFAKQLKAAYGTAPFYKDVATLVEKTLGGPHDTVAQLAERSIREVMDYVGLKRNIRLASALEPEASGKHLKGEERLIHIARAVGASHYNNPPGGRELYSSDAFAAAGIALRFVRPHLPPYDRPAPFIPGLSILDALMYIPPEEITGMMAQYSVEQ